MITYNEEQAIYWFEILIQIGLIIRLYVVLGGLYLLNIWKYKLAIIITVNQITCTFPRLNNFICLQIVWKISIIIQIQNINKVLIIKISIKSYSILNLINICIKLRYKTFSSFKYLLNKNVLRDLIHLYNYIKLIYEITLL